MIHDYVEAASQNLDFALSVVNSTVINTILKAHTRARSQLDEPTTHYAPLAQLTRNKASLGSAAGYCFHCARCTKGQIAAWQHARRSRLYAEMCCVFSGLVEFCWVQGCASRDVAGYWEKWDPGHRCLISIARLSAQRKLTTV